MMHRLPRVISKHGGLIALSLALAVVAGCASNKPSATPSERTPRAEDLPDFASVRVVGGEAPQGALFHHYGTNPTVDTSEEPVSTFSIDVDTASYALARGMLEGGALPDPAAIRVEELVNAFPFDYPPPQTGPFSVVAEAFPSPNRKGYHVLLLGLRGRVVAKADRPPANLVFVVDVSGSMGTPAADGAARLELVKSALGVLVDELRADDSVAVVVYGDNARVMLPATSGADKENIKRALMRLQPEGSTNVQAGILLGYEVATSKRTATSTNRIVLCSDGVANSGITDADGIFRTVDERARTGVTLSTVGFGMSAAAVDYNDVLMEQLAVRGQGRYAYVDRIAEARKIFVDDLNGALVTIASDVKVQLEFDPRSVERYRLIGYENRKLTRGAFQDDAVDAGEIGAGHEVTALYEVKLKPGAVRIGSLRIRAKDPRDAQGAGSRLVEEELTTRLVRKDLASASPLSKLALVAAAFGEKLRGSYWARNLAWDDVHALWRSLPNELRDRADVSELGALIGKAKALDRRGDRFETESPVASMGFDDLPVLRRGADDPAQP